MVPGILSKEGVEFVTILSMNEGQKGVTMGEQASIY